jgi:hypothetical protein
MPSNTKTLEESLLEKGIEGWYTWRPNQVYTKNPSDPSSYLPTDVVMDRMIENATTTISEECDRQVQAIEAAGETAINSIEQDTNRYSQLKQICLGAFSSLRNYFSMEDIPVAVSIVDKAIRDINALS